MRGVLDRSYFDLGKVLAVTLALPVAGLGVVSENKFLFVPRLAQYFSLNFGAVQVRHADFGLTVARDQKNLIEGKFRPLIAHKAFYFEFSAGGNLILLAAGFDYRKLSHRIRN